MKTICHLCVIYIFHLLGLYLKFEFSLKSDDEKNILILVNFLKANNIENFNNMTILNNLSPNFILSNFLVGSYFMLIIRKNEPNQN